MFILCSNFQTVIFEFHIVFVWYEVLLTSFFLIKKIYLKCEFPSLLAANIDVWGGWVWPVGCSWQIPRVSYGSKGLCDFFLMVLRWVRRAVTSVCTESSAFALTPKDLWTACSHLSKPWGKGKILNLVSWFYIWELTLSSLHLCPF